MDISLSHFLLQALYFRVKIEATILISLQHVTLLFFGFPYVFIHFCLVRTKYKEKQPCLT